MAVYYIFMHQFYLLWVVANIIQRVDSHTLGTGNLSTLTWAIIRMPRLVLRHAKVTRLLWRTTFVVWFIYFCHHHPPTTYCDPWYKLLFSIRREIKFSTKYDTTGRHGNTPSGRFPSRIHISGMLLLFLVIYSVLLVAGFCYQYLGGLVAW